MASPSGNRQSGGTVPVVSARHTDGVDGQRVCVCVCDTNWDETIEWHTSDER